MPHRGEGTSSCLSSIPVSVPLISLGLVSLHCLVQIFFYEKRKASYVRSGSWKAHLGKPEPQCDPLSLSSGKQHHPCICSSERQDQLPGSQCQAPNQSMEKQLPEMERMTHRQWATAQPVIVYTTALPPSNGKFLCSGYDASDSDFPQLSFWVFCSAHVSS